MSTHRRPEAARVGGLERAATPAEECGLDKAKPQPARSGGGGGAGGGRRGLVNDGETPGAQWGYVEIVEWVGGKAGAVLPYCL